MAGNESDRKSQSLVTASTATVSVAFTPRYTIIHNDFVFLPYNRDTRLAEAVVTTPPSNLVATNPNSKERIHITVAVFAISSSFRTVLFLASPWQPESQPTPTTRGHFTTTGASTTTTRSAKGERKWRKRKVKKKVRRETGEEDKRANKVREEGE